jgi:hypothetical protein
MPGLDSRVGENRRTWLEQKRTDGYDVMIFIFIIFNLEHKWTRLMLCPLRNTLRKAHESSRKPTKTTSLKPGDGITLMRIFYLSGKIPENTVCICMFFFIRIKIIN